MTIRSSGLAALSLACFATATSAAAATLPGADQIVSRTLPNGLQIVVWRDADIPNVAMYTWYRVGSRNERPGITGIAHFFEHMMFNGTKTHPAGEFDRVMAAGGGRNNAAHQKCRGESSGAHLPQCRAAGEAAGFNRLGSGRSIWVHDALLVAAIAARMKRTGGPSYT